MGISVLRSSEDVSAPELIANNQGSLVQLLKTVLVDGYGTGVDEKPALGWDLYAANSVTHTDITEAVFRNTLGSGYYLMADGSGVRNTVAVLQKNWTYLRAAESVESYTSGLGYAPPTTDWPGGYVPIGYSSISSAQVPWRIIGNEKSFWIIVRPRWNHFAPGVRDYNKYNWQPYFFGDYESLYIENTWPFALIQESHTTEQMSSWLNNTRSIPSSYILRGINWAPGGRAVDIYSGDISGGTAAFAPALGPTAGTVYPHFLTKYTIVDGTRIMGNLPGIRVVQMQDNTTAGVLPDKVVEYDDFTLHYFYASNGVYMNGYFVMVEGAGYDNDL